MEPPDGPAHSRAPSGVPLREYYRGKSEHAAAAAAAPRSPQHVSQPASQQHPPARRQSTVSKLLARISPSKGGASAPQPIGVSPASKSRSSMPMPEQQHAAAPAGIPAFRPPSPPPQQYGPAGGACSPGKAQLQAVRALAAKQQQQQQTGSSQGTPQGTPGFSATSVGRDINAKIARSIADMLGATPEVCSSAAHEDAAEQQAQQMPLQQAEQQSLPPTPQHPRQQQQQRAPPATSAQSMPSFSIGGAARLQLRPASTAGSSGARGAAAAQEAPTPVVSISPFGDLPAPALAPPALKTAMSTSSVLAEQSIKSPMFMSRRQRSMYCEMDDPGSGIAFPKQRHHTSGVRRFFALFGCFVPPPSSRSPAPSLRTPGGRRTPSSQGASPGRPVHLYGMDPLRQSMAELALGDPELRETMRASLAGGPMQQGQAQHPQFADLLGLQEEEAQANMASPVLPTRPASAADTPTGCACAEQHAPSPLAKRDLMAVLRSKEAGVVRQLQQQQPPQALPGQQQQGASSTAQGRQPVQQPVPAHLPAKEARRLSGFATAPGSSRVSLAELLAAPAAGASQLSVAPAGEPLPQEQRGQAPLRPKQAAGAGRPRQPSTGSKRGREALGVSRAPSDDTPVFTPKQPRRDLSKPSYRSQALHQRMSPAGRPAPAFGAAPRAATPAAPAFGGHTPTPASTKLGGPAAAAAAAARQPSAKQPWQGSVSAPVSPQHGAVTRPASRANPGSAPSSPGLLGTRLTHAAAVRAAATQSKLQEVEAQLQKLMAKSPNRWLKAAAAQGLSLREAAVFSSPGNVARPPSRRPASAGDRGAAAVQHRAAPPAVAATPGGNRFNSFAAGESGAPPYSARMTVERPAPQRPVQAAAAAPQAAPTAVAPAVPAAQSGSSLDFEQLAAGGNAYMQMLQSLAAGLHVDHSQIAPFTKPSVPPLPADLLAGAAAAAAAARDPGADTVRPRLGASQEVLASSRPSSSRTAGSTAEYCLHGEGSRASVESAEKLPAAAAVCSAHVLAAPTPHHNALFGKDATPTKSSPIAQQRMVSLTAAVAAAAVEQQQRTSSASGSGSGTGSDASISFGQRLGEEGSGESAASAGGRQGSPGKRRLEALAVLFEQAEAAGRHITLDDLHSYGYSRHDLFALKKREAGKQRQQGDSGDVARQAPLTRQEPGLVVQCHRIAQQAAATAGQLGAVVAAAVTTAAAPLLELQQWQAQQAAGRRQLLLASVSGSTLDQPQKAYLPDKRRLAGAARGGGDAGGSSGGDGGPNLLVDAADNERFLISEIDVVGVDGELKDMALQALNARANFAYSLKEIMDDMHRVFDTGYFSSCKPRAEETRDGIKLTLEVAPNPELRGFTVTGANALPQAVIEEAFSGLHGRTLNFNSMVQAVGKLNRWYEEKGVLGQVVDVDTSSSVAEIKVAEAVVNRVLLRYIDRNTNEARDEGRTKPHIILRNLTTKPGQVFSLHQGRRDIDAVYSMGLFEDVSMRPQPAEGSSLDQPKVDLTLEIKERKTGGLSAGGGISAAGATEGALPGVVGEVAYSQRNLFGLGQRLVASAKLGQTDAMFRVQHTDPWVRGDRHRTSRTTTVQNDKSSVAPIHGRAQDDVEGSASAAPGGSDAVFVSRKLASVEYARPLTPSWQFTVGASWQQSNCVDEHGQLLGEDLYHAPLTFSGREHDTMALVNMRLAYTQPSGDTELVGSMEQAMPVWHNYLNFNRFTLRAEKTLPLGPLRLWARGKGGMIFGDLPPYEAFPIGGTNSVRGYGEGGVGTGRNYVAGSAELRVPLFSPVEATLFGDWGSDLDSGASIPGDPAGSRGKPGSGYGYGAGVRIDTPIGPLRLEYAMNDRGATRFHLGIGSNG